MSPTSEQILFQSTKDPLTLMQLDHQENSSLVAKGENRAGGPSNVEIVTFNSKRLQDELHAVGVEIKQHEDKIQFLNAQRKKRGESILNLQAILSKYKSSAAHRTESEDNSNIQNEDITSEQILQHESSAAGLFYLIKNQHGTRASQLMSTKDVLGTVAELGKVDDENLSSLLSEYLGTRTMLAFVCKTYDGVKTLELYDKEGNVTRNDGLHGLCSSIGRTIKGRFDVIYLEDLRPYSGQFVADDPQRRLDLLKPKLPGGDCPHGFLGFAVNMIDVEPKNLLCVTAYGCGLRETLFYSLFSHLQVYKTRADMINALPCISRGAISLDGGMIRTAGVFSLGSRDEVNVRFAKPSATSCVTDYFTETNKHMEELTRKQEKLEEDIKREQVLLDHAKFNFGKKKEEFLRSMAQSSSYNIQVWPRMRLKNRSSCCVCSKWPNVGMNKVLNSEELNNNQKTSPHLKSGTKTGT